MLGDARLFSVVFADGYLVRLSSTPISEADERLRALPPKCHSTKTLAPADSMHEYSDETATGAINIDSARFGHHCPRARARTNIQGVVHRGEAIRGDPRTY